MARVAITGAHGFLGSALLASAPSDSVSVVTLGRHALDIPWDMRTGQSVDLTGVDAVIHGAWMLQPRDAPTAQANVEASRQLLSSAVAAGSRLVFVSTMSASDSTTSLYGRSKRAFERMVLSSPSGVVVRPGTIQDASGGLGMLTQTLGSIAGLPVRPRVKPDPQVPMVSLARVVDAVWHLALDEQVEAGVVELVDEWRPLSALVDSVAQGPARASMTVPGGLINGVVAASAALPVQALRDVADSWRGLMDAGRRNPSGA